MKLRKYGSLLLAAALITGSMPVGFAESIDLKYSDMLTQKMASMSTAQKENYAQMLEVALYNPATIQATINLVNSTLTDAEKASLAAKNITTDYIINSLEVLKTWSEADRAQLIAYAKTGNVSAIESLNTKNATSSGNNSGGTTTPPANGGTTTPPANGGTTTPPATGGTTTPPATGGTTTPPATGGTTTPPATGGTTTPPATGTTTTPKVELSDDALDALLNSKEFLQLINIDSEETAKGSIAALATDSVVYTIRQGIQKTAFNLPEEIKNVATLIKVTSPKTTSTKMDALNMLSKVFVNQTDLTKTTKLVSFKDITSSKANQLTASFFLNAKVIAKDSKGNAGLTQKLTTKDLALYVTSTFKAMGIDLPKDAKKQAAIKDISKLKANEQQALAQLYSMGVLTIDKTGKINPAKELTQADLSALMKKIYDYYYKTYKL